MQDTQLSQISNFIWGVADDYLRDLYVRGKYRDVILPMTVLRRLDAVLEPTKEKVLDEKKWLDDAGISEQASVLEQAAEKAFYNTSPFQLRDLTSRATQQQLRDDFNAYLDEFSPNVKDILDKFEFRNQIQKLSEGDVLGSIVSRFLNPQINLSPDPVLNQDGTVRLPGLDNHAMGTIFEDLVRRFNEENNEEAGEHWTPRDAVELMAQLVFQPVRDQVESGTYLLYDGAIGTGGMLTIAEQTLQAIAAEGSKQVTTHLYGQGDQPGGPTRSARPTYSSKKGRTQNRTSLEGRSIQPCPATPSGPIPSTSCSAIPPTGRAGRATWTGWAGSPASRTPGF